MVLLVYYSPASRRRLESALHAQHLEVYAVDARAPNAVDAILKHPAEVVVMDAGADDISVSLALRQLGQMMPRRLVITAHPGREKVDLYRDGRRVGVERNLELAIGRYDHWPDTGAP